MCLPGRCHVPNRKCFCDDNTATAHIPQQAQQPISGPLLSVLALTVIPPHLILRHRTYCINNSGLPVQRCSGAEAAHGGVLRIKVSAYVPTIGTYSDLAADPLPAHFNRRITPTSSRLPFPLSSQPPWKAASTRQYPVPTVH